MKITKRSLENIVANGREYFVWDEIVTGFGVRVSPRGRKSFIVQYRSGGRTRRMSLGAQGALTPDEARNIAKSILGDVARGTEAMLFAGN